MSQAAVERISTSLAEAVEEIQRRHVLAWNTHDRAAFESLFTEDADFVNVLAQHARGRIQIGLDFEYIHARFMRNSVVSMEKPQVRQLTETTAIAHHRWEMTGVEHVPGWNVPDVRHGLLLYVLVKQAGEWRIAAVQNTEEISITMPR